MKTISPLRESSEINKFAVDQSLDLGGASSSSRNRGGWILYDRDCRYCIAAATRFAPIFAKRGFRFIPLQTPWVQQRLGLVPGAPLEEMRVLTLDDTDLGGADAILFLARQVWWLWPLSIVGRLPGMHGVVDAGYRWIAAHRGCVHLAQGGQICLVRPVNRPSARERRGIGGLADEMPVRLGPSASGRCHLIAESPVRKNLSIHSWVPLAILPLAALCVHGRVAPWVFMWLMAGAIFLGCKWLTLDRAKRRGIRPSLRRQLAYLFLWAGMDAESFLGPQCQLDSTTDTLRRLSWALGKVAAGVGLLFGLARHLPNELLAGWAGMIGTILILHFGLFDLAASCWRLAGVNARPIMNAPLRSTSVSEFWGRRWNQALHQLVMQVFFRSFARSFGVVRATLVGFFISGLIHELVISVPAGAGYGLPAGYFLLQGWAVIAQRTPIGQFWWHRRPADNLPGSRASRPCYDRGIPARIFTFTVIAAPAFWLFHPPFVHRVIIPFMQAIGAL